MTVLPRSCLQDYVLEANLYGGSKTMNLKDSNIIMTGGAGTLGRAIAARRKKEGWTGKLTVYSTSNHNHASMRRGYPDVNFVQGDIRNAETLYNAMVGHDICLHLAAVKVIPDSEYFTLDTIDVNVNGSINVCVQSMAAGIKHVVGISTDKAAYPANAYGATKLLMEKIFQEYSRVDSDTQFHLVRYGNVLESNGSVLEFWGRAIEHGESIKITNPEMTRFWLSPQQAVTLVINSLALKSGHIYIPKVKGLSIWKLAAYVFEGKEWSHVIIPLRPGEKMHECLMTRDEAGKAFNHSDFYELMPSTSEVQPYHLFQDKDYTSDSVEEMTREELMELLADG